MPASTWRVPTAAPIGSPKHAIRCVGCSSGNLITRWPGWPTATRYLKTIEPENPQNWIATAAVAARLLRQEEALAAYERAAQLKPEEVRLRTSIGHVHKTLGHRAESEAAYKTAIAIDPANAEAYWSLADLKNYTFSDAEVAAMQRVLADERRPTAGDAQLHFALGKACEQREQYPQAFAYYARGNARRWLDASFDIEAFERRGARIRTFFDARFFAAHAASGNASRAPIFIVGLPRSGSTLIEQILASHHPGSAAWHARHPLPRGDRPAAPGKSALHRQAAEQFQSYRQLVIAGRGQLYRLAPDLEPVREFPGQRR